MMATKLNSFASAAIAVATWLVPLCVAAADITPPAAQVCAGCGVIQNIRRIDKPAPRERTKLPSIDAAPSAGGMGNTVQTVPLFSIGKDGAHRVQREPATQPVWEITVRYDHGSFAFVTVEAEPELNVGDRVRHIENTLELLTPPAR